MQSQTRLDSSRSQRVPPAHGEWFRDQLPDARLEVVSGVGHLVVVPFWGAVLDHLLVRRT